MTSIRGPLPRMRRRYPRLTLRVEVVIEAASERIQAVATTLGAGGLFVATRAPFPPRTPLVVRFRLPGDSTELRFQCHVVWSKTTGDAATPGVGLELDDSEARAEFAVLLERWAERRETAAGSGAGRI